MKKITYKERATFYIQEVNKDYKKIKLLKTIKKKYNINSMVLCPCASGIYLRECSELFEESYFIDIEKIIYSENYPNYIKSLIEIGRLDEYIVSKISSLDSINIERCFLETNRYTRIQNINITKKVLTQTTIISEG